MKLIYLNIESICTIKSYFGKLLSYYDIDYNQEDLVPDGDFPIHRDLMQRLSLLQTIQPLPEKVIGSIQPDPITVKNLNYLIKSNNAKVILTHPTRLSLNNTTANILLRSYGIKGVCIDTTPQHYISDVYTGCIKGEEILTSVSTKWKCENFVIIDHMISEIEPLFDNIIPISFLKGFNSECLLESIKMINNSTSYMNIILNLDNVKKKHADKMVGFRW